MIPNKDLIENTPPTLSENCLLSDADRVYPKGTLLKWVLDNCPNTIIQGAIKAFDLTQIYSKLKSNIAMDFPNYRDEHGRLQYMRMSIEFCEDMREYQVDWQFLKEANTQIDKIRIEMKVIGKNHPKYAVLAYMHDALVIANNKFNEPIEKFLKDYLYARKEKGKKVNIEFKRERVFIPKLKIGVR